METDIKRFRASMRAIQEAIYTEVRASGVRIESRNFLWNAGLPLAVVPESVTLRVQLGPYRCFEEIFSRDQIELGVRDPTVAAYIAFAVLRLASGTAPQSSAAR